MTTENFVQTYSSSTTIRSLQETWVESSVTAGEIIKAGRLSRRAVYDILRHGRHGSIVNIEVIARCLNCRLILGRQVPGRNERRLH